MGDNSGWNPFRGGYSPGGEDDIDGWKPPLKGGYQPEGKVDEPPGQAGQDKGEAYNEFGKMMAEACREHYEELQQEARDKELNEKVETVAKEIGGKKLYLGFINPWRTILNWGPVNHEYVLEHEIDEGKLVFRYEERWPSFDHDRHVSIVFDEEFWGEKELYSETYASDDSIESSIHAYKPEDESYVHIPWETTLDELYQQVPDDN